MFWHYIFIFIISCILLYFSGELVVKNLMRMARFLEWREFVVAFFIIAFASSIPNLFVGISSALHKIPQLSFGEVMGGNVIDLTLAVAIAALIAKGLPAKSRVVQTTSIFTIAITILPLLLVLDGILGRGDGIILILAFSFYLYWLFSKKERFTRVYEKESKSPSEISLRGEKISIIKKFTIFIKDLGRVILGIGLLLLAGEGIVMSASFFAQSLNLPLVLVGILIIGFGNALPETYFAIVSAKRGQTWMILGDLMGAVIVPTALVLGIVALICPIEILDFSPFVIARFFLIIAALFFFFFVRTGRKITKKEAFFLLGIYIAFLMVEILTK